jgi:hypothetical protein
VGADWSDALAAVLYGDRYGNLMCGLLAASLPLQAKIRAAGRVLERARTFCEVPPGEPFWCENALGLVEIAVNQGRADRLCSVWFWGIRSRCRRRQERRQPVCELFTMCSRVPATVDLSLERLARHGGDEGPHRDGWGCAFYDGSDLFLVREPHPAAHSPLMRLLETQRRRGCAVLCHLRLASFGGRALRNTQPFARELGGMMQSFAHNGYLHGIRSAPALRPGRFRPVGDNNVRKFNRPCEPKAGSGREGSEG